MLRRRSPRRALGRVFRPRGPNVFSPIHVGGSLPDALERSETALTAAGVLITTGNSPAMRRLIQPWQQRSLAYYDLVGEAWFASQFYARHLAQIRLYVAEKDESGELKEVEADDPANEYLEVIRDPGGVGRSQFQAAYGRLMFITGEGYVCVTEDSGTEEQQWEFLSSDELRVDSQNTYWRYQAPSLGPEQLHGEQDNAHGEYFSPVGQEATVYRFWKKHPRYSAWADSPMKGVLDVLEELLLLQQAVAARVKSRLSSAGLLLWPEEATLKSQDSQKSDEDILDDPLLAELVASANAAIKEPGSASAQTPVIVRIAAEYIEKVTHIQFFDPAIAYPETGLRTECIRRYSLGVDMPPEVLLGMADANHWSSWQIDETTARAHIFPICQALCDDLNSAYFRAALKEAGIEGWEKKVITYDPSAIVVAPDQSKTALELYKEGAISLEALREASDFEDSDAMDESEYAKWVGLQLNSLHTALTGEEPETPEPLALNPGDPQLALPVGEEKVDPKAIEKGAPVKKPQADPKAPAVTASALAADIAVERVLGAAEMAVHRGRSLAGARLRSKLTAEEREEHRDVPNGLLAAVLGPERIVPISSSAEALVAGAGLELSSMARGLGFETNVAAGIARQVEIHAARSLFVDTPPPLPDALRTMLAPEE